MVRRNWFLGWIQLEEKGLAQKILLVSPGLRVQLVLLGSHTNESVYRFFYAELCFETDVM